MCRLILLAAALLGLLPSTLAPQTPPPAAAEAARPFVVKVEGSGRPMILIPGLLSSGEVWEGAVAHYRGRYRTHTLTLAGFAGVPPIAAEPFLQAERDAIVRYIREQKLERPVLVGHSLGAFLAFWVAATAPELVGPVVAVDGVPYLATLGDSSLTPERMRPQAEMGRAMYATLTPGQVAMQTRMALQGQVRDSLHRERGVRWGRASDPTTVGRAVAEMLTTDLRGAVAAIRTPVLLVACGDGLDEARRAATLARYRAQVSRVPDARVVVAANARHFVMLDDPAFLFDAVDRFLAGR
jgi:pimeloyl-ACP methyl ester carboxylesterase